MKGFVELFARVNLRHFGERRLRVLLTLGGIAAGVGLVVSIAVINATLQVSVRGSGPDPTGAADIEVQPATVTGLSQSAVGAIQRVDGVRDAIPFVRVAAPVSGDAGEARAIVLGGTGPSPSLRRARGSGQGRAPTTSPRASLRRGVRLTPTLAGELGADVGERVEVETPRGPVALEVVGRVTGDAVERINAGRVAWMHFRAAQTTFAKGGAVDAIYVVADQGASIPVLEARIRERLHGAALVGAPGKVSRGFDRTLGPLAVAGSVSGLVALLVALFIVYNTMSMAFAERRWEVSMAVALGASRRQLVAAFLSEACLLGAVASVIGVLAGALLAEALTERAIADYRGLTVGLATPPVIHARDLAIGGLGGVLVSVLGAAIPARRVLTVTPIESLSAESAHEWAATVRNPGSTRRHVAAGVIALAMGSVGMLLSVRLIRETWIATATMICWLAGVAMLLPHAMPPVGRILVPMLGRTFGPLGRLAGDALIRNPGRTALTAGALIVSSAMAVAVASGIDSYEARFARAAQDWFGADLYVVAGSSSGIQADQPVNATLARTLRGVEGVRAAYPQRYVVTRVSGEPALVYALPIAQAAREGVTRTLSESGADQDALIRGLGRGEVSVSRFTASRLDAAVGDPIRISTPSGARRFRIAAVFKDLVAFDTLQMEYRTYARVWKDSTADRFAVIADPGADIDQLALELTEAIDARSFGGRVLTEQEAVEELVGGVDALVSLARSLQLVALVVAALAIANTLFAAVLERRWEFALQRVLGMSRSEVSRSLLLEAGVIGLIGSVVGVLLGVGMGFVMTRAMVAGYSWDIPFAIPWGLLGFGLLGGIAIAVAAGVTPARLAVRTPIIEALRR